MGNAKLLEAIEWSYTIGEETLDLTAVGKLAPEAISEAIVISGHMREDAGNEYQNLCIEGIGITVSATQDTVEYDSYDNQYDANANSVFFAQSLAALTPGTPMTITLTENVGNITGIKTEAGEDLTVDLNSNTLTVGSPVGSSGTVSNGMQLLQGSDVTLANGTYAPDPGNTSVQILVQNYSNLTLDSVTLDARGFTNCGYALSTNCGEVLIKGNTNIYVDAGKTALDVMHWESVASYKAAGTHVVFDATMTGTVDGKIEVYCYRNGVAVKPVDDGGATLTIMGGTFINSGLTLAEFQAFVPTGYAVTTNADGSFTVHAA